MARLQDRYKTEIVPALQKELGRPNALSLPRLTKIVVSMGLGKAILEKKRLTNAVDELGVMVEHKTRGVDEHVNYKKGVAEQLIYSEVNVEKVEFQKGMFIAFCGDHARNDRESH